MASEQATTPTLLKLLSDATLAGDWTLDPAQSTVSLKNKSIWGLVPVKGVFRQVSGAGTISPTGEVSGAVMVAAASVDTKNARRDTHLRSADFFNVECYPDIVFTVEAIRPSGLGVSITGTLRVRDQARPLTLDATAALYRGGEVRLDALVDIHQPDFGVTWNFLGMVSTRTTVSVHAVFTRH